MEIIIGLVIVVGGLAYLMLRKQPETSTPAPTIVQGGEPISTIVVEGAGKVDVPKTSEVEQRMWEQSLANLEKEKAEEAAKAVAVEEPAKKPRKPRAPKVGATAVKAAKAADKATKKAVPAKKPAAKKATKKA
jgi:hypothetical protein